MVSKPSRPAMNFEGTYFFGGGFWRASNNLDFEFAGPRWLVTTVMDGILPEMGRHRRTSSKCCEEVAKRSAPRKRSHTPAALSRKRKGPLYLTELYRNEGWIKVSVAHYVYCLETTNLMTFRKGKLMKLFCVKFHFHVIGKMLGNPPWTHIPLRIPFLNQATKKTQNSESYLMKS